MRCLVASTTVLSVLVAGASLCCVRSQPAQSMTSTDMFMVQGAEHLAGHLGTKTPYAARLDAEHPGEEPESCAADVAEVGVFKTKEGQDQQCEIVHVYKVVRHGTRYPTEKSLRKLRAMAEILGEKDLEFRDEDAGLLTESGDAELEAMGRRFQLQYSSLFEGGYHPVRHDVRSSQVTRALQSAAAFCRGAFGSNVSVAIRSETKAHDRHLRFHKACPRYASEVKKNKTLEETGPLGRVAEMVYADVFARIMSRVRQKDAELYERMANLGTKMVVHGVWDLCVMHLAALNTDTPACGLLDQSDVELLAYMDDVESYWLKGYGFQINYEMACPLVHDISQTTREIATLLAGSEEDAAMALRRTTLRFGHAETIIPLVARLGLYRDPEGHSPYEVAGNASPGTVRDKLNELRVAARHWRSGRVSPFAANVAVVLLRCEDTSGDGPADPFTSFYVQILHNEAVVPMPDSLCTNASGPLKSLCGLDDFLAQLDAEAGPCDFDDLCGV